ncbi:transposase [Streptomyces sp. NBC_01235]|uniref:transposase n=1 Tax=Streptomyces sp. NBC_01235 TaxID=2903788 RepID=UPI003FA355B2
MTSAVRTSCRQQLRPSPRRCRSARPGPGCRPRNRVQPAAIGFLARFCGGAGRRRWSQPRPSGQRRIAERMVPLIGPHGWAVDDVSFPKDGRMSVGAAHQRCGTLGKQANCQVAASVHGSPTPHRSRCTGGRSRPRSGRTMPYAAVGAGCRRRSGTGRSDASPWTP